MSNLRLSTLLGALIASATLIVSCVLEDVAHKDIVPDSVTLCFFLAVLITWFGFFAAWCRDSIVKHIDDKYGKAIEHVDAEMRILLDAINSYGDDRDIAARKDTVRTLASAGVNVTNGRRGEGRISAVPDAN